MYIRTYVFVSFETTPVVRIQILIDPTFNSFESLCSFFVVPFCDAALLYILGWFTGIMSQKEILVLFSVRTLRIFRLIHFVADIK